MAPGLLAFSLIIALASSELGAAANVRPVQVNVTNFGLVNGYEEETRAERVRKNIHCFLGIPFAQPPIKNLRFRPPEPLEPSNNAEYDATQLPTSCYQAVDTQFEEKYVSLWNPNTNMSEDCLYLNIWKPERASNKAVMVWIYGGGFASGTSTLKLYDGKILAAKRDVIVVSMQYRIGVFGFLSLGSDSSAPGNAGLLDQQLALRWIHDHIADFGGDPKRVTIFGESAGAASVNYHLLSPGSADLFNSAIMQSATAVAPWAFVEVEEAKKRTYELAKLVGCSRDNTIECLREKTADQLTKKQSDVQSVSSFPFVPTVDHKFLNEKPQELLKSGTFQQKNILVGLDSHEGSFFIIYKFPETFDPTKDYNHNVTTEEYREMVKKLRLVDSSSDVVTDTIASVYSLPCGLEGNSGDDAAISYFMSLDGMFGDVWFKCPVVHTAKAHARESKTEGSHQVYMYAFNHRTSDSPWPEWAGDALHGYEIDHVFGVPFRDDSYSRYGRRERELSNQVMTFWTNFAKNGDPNIGETVDIDIEWPKYTVDGRDVLVLDTSNGLRIQKGLRDRHCQFWSEFVPTLRNAVDNGQASAMHHSISLPVTAVLTLVAVLLL